MTLFAMSNSKEKIMRIVAAASCLLVVLGLGNAAWAEDAPKADNSAQNKGATRDDAVTAEKQSNEKDDVKALAEVRKSIMNDKDLSMDAKNVKILYSKGRVTLRGPVNSAEEKAKVEELAKSCSCVTSVKNLLTVAAKPH
jgi:osmotically-inducible protein OsmY